ncbi:MAG: sugar ABC transporter permease [Elusimicrobia bacterium CG08_land_8_20_14_0_20_51_18]|nr:MAG: sugar ABC transporter permease [Elusimicrobia bacterium CG08_land_8_20_14_0_20_51_18]
MKEESVKKLLTTLTAVFMIGFAMTPFLYMLFTSVNAKPDFLEAGWLFTLSHYRDVLGADSLHFLDYLKNSILVSAAASLVTVFIASISAFAITRLEMKGKLFVLFFVLAVSMFPQVSMIGYLFKIMTALGLINTYPALIMPYIAWILPLSLWILVSYFSQIPKELDKAAIIDGCNEWQVLFKVLFPVALPGIFSTLLLSFIFAFNEFIFALILTTDFNARTIPVGIALFEGLHGQIPWGQIMAASVVTVFPIMIMTLVFQRHIIGGLTKGAVKG